MSGYASALVPGLEGGPHYENLTREFIAARGKSSVVAVGSAEVSFHEKRKMLL